MNEKKNSMMIPYDNTHSTKRLPKSQTLLFNSNEYPLKLNIKLKTHSLTSLDIPIDTFPLFKKHNISSSSFRNAYQKTMAGSVDLISEIQQQSNNENDSHFSSSKPLINLISSDKQQVKGQQELKKIIKNRFRISNSFNNSIARLRRNDQLQNSHQSSLQTFSKVTNRKHRLSLNHHGSIPKFTFRDLPSTSINRSKQSSKFQMSPFTSLPEIRSFVAQNCSDNAKTINDKQKLPPLSALPSWQKTGSWSWKSNDAIYINRMKNERSKSKLSYEDLQYQINHSNLPVIIESPLQQQRSSLQVYHHSPIKLKNISHSNLSQHSSKLYQKKSLFPHSISNYEVSPNKFSSQSTTRYPSTPLLAYSRRQNLNKFPYHSCELHRSPLATFDDDDDDDDTDSILSNSSFRSCINDFSEINTTELSSMSDKSFQEMSSCYNLDPDIFNETVKHSRLSMRHLCILQ